MVELQQKAGVQLGHVGINVPDLALAVALFTDTLGFDLVWSSSLSDGDGDGMARWFGLAQDASVQFAFVGSSANDVYIELLQWTTGLTAPDHALCDPGGRHLALWVADLPTTIRDLHAAGCHVYQPHPAGYVYAKTDWGLYLQLMPIKADGKDNGDPAAPLGT
ncbi:MAG: VOC family protein [Gordonia sp. (in: high G+C Gram-positive bacteria)]|uniref:VOC family protein n=1 Tax=Gordonia sp. (in: high G+C Gram-positive bacteria) TaxID=84139 RepID=UPI003BB4DDCD